MTVYSCRVSLGEILFPVNSAAGFIYVSYSDLMTGRTDLYHPSYFYLLIASMNCIGHVAYARNKLL